MNDVRDEVLKCLPHLRAFARSLVSNRNDADDLVHDAIARALEAADQFTPGTNFKAWIFTILRNLYFNELRKRRRSAEQVDSTIIENLATPPTQEKSLELSDFRKAFIKLSAEHREALVLVGAGGFSYEEAAKVANCPAGTVKSRVSRARRELAEMLDPAQHASPIEQRPKRSFSAKTPKPSKKKIAPR